MSTSLIFFIILAYFALLMLIAKLTGGHSRDNSFFDGGRSSHWFLVAFGMIADYKKPVHQS
jgi:Na+/proline symporter